MIPQPRAVIGVSKYKQTATRHPWRDGPPRVEWGCLNTEWFLIQAIGYKHIGCASIYGHEKEGWIALDNPYNIPSSEDPITQSLIKEEVHKWQKEGARIVYRHRVNREGYKAGNLKSSMNCSFVKDYITMSIFDADFQLLPDFLKKKHSSF
ncbi:unnamed protein product [Brassica rapa subsp. narinosa]